MALRKAPAPSGGGAAGRRFRGRLIAEASTQTDAHLAVSLFSEVAVQSAVSCLGGVGPGADGAADEALHALIAGVRYAQAMGVSVADSLLPALKQLAARYEAEAAQPHEPLRSPEHERVGVCGNICNVARDQGYCTVPAPAEHAACTQPAASPAEVAYLWASREGHPNIESTSHGAMADGAECAAEWRMVQKRLLCSTWHDKVRVVSPSAACHCWFAIRARGCCARRAHCAQCGFDTRRVPGDLERSSLVVQTTQDKAKALMWHMNEVIGSLQAAQRMQAATLAQLQETLRLAEAKQQAQAGTAAGLTSHVRALTRHGALMRSDASWHCIHVAPLFAVLDTHIPAEAPHAGRVAYHVGGDAPA